MIRVFGHAKQNRTPSKIQQSTAQNTLLEQALQFEQQRTKDLQHRFGFNRPYLVLSVFTGENLTAMRGILDELKQDDDWAIIEKFFLFARLDDLINDFYKGLGYFGGNKKPVPFVIKKI